MGNLRAPLDFLAPLTGGTPNVRDALDVAQSLTAGNPNLRVPLDTALSLTGGQPNIRAALDLAQPLTGGQPNVRACLMIVQALIPVPEEQAVATDVFPTLIGVTWDISKNPEFNTAVRGATSGKEVANAFRPYPVWQFDLAYDFVPDEDGHPLPASAAYTDLRTLQGFFLNMRGKFKTWLYRDRDDYHGVGEFIAAADGVTLQWPFLRDFGSFLEPVGQIDQSILASFPASAVNTGTDAINVNGHGLANGQGPFFLANSGALPTPLAALTPYWAIVVDANNFKLATSEPLAIAGVAINITVAGSGTNTLSKGFAVYETVAEAHNVPAPSGPYTITVSNAAVFISDGGVTLSGAALAKVSGAPAAGQYAVDTTTGVYTFNAAQASAAVVITYTYQATASGVSLTAPNQLVFGSAPASGLTITADFDFWFVCRFNDDVSEFKQFVSKLWELGKLDFHSVPQ